MPILFLAGRARAHIDDLSDEMDEFEAATGLDYLASVQLDDVQFWMMDALVGPADIAATISVPADLFLEFGIGEIVEKPIVRREYRALQGYQANPEPDVLYEWAELNDPEDETKWRVWSHGLSRFMRSVPLPPVPHPSNPKLLLVEARYNWEDIPRTEDRLNRAAQMISPTVRVPWRSKSGAAFLFTEHGPAHNVMAQMSQALKSDDIFDYAILTIGPRYVPARGICPLETMLTAHRLSSRAPAAVSPKPQPQRPVVVERLQKKGRRLISQIKGR